MSQHNEKNPHQHQSPLHDSSEAKPGMDSLAPEDGSSSSGTDQHRRVHNLPPRSLKAPDTRNEKNLILWKTYAKAVKNYALTTNQACASPMIKTHCVPVAVVQRCWKILFCARKSPTLTMSAFRNVLFMHADQPAHGYFQP